MEWIYILSQEDSDREGESLETPTHSPTTLNEPRDTDKKVWGIAARNSPGNTFYAFFYIEHIQKIVEIHPVCGQCHLRS